MPPIYASIRRRGHVGHDAQDLNQSFFAALLSREGLAKVQFGNGKFRSILLASVNNFLANHNGRQQAAKRGGGQTICSPDAWRRWPSRQPTQANPPVRP